MALVMLMGLSWVEMAKRSTWPTLEAWTGLSTLTFLPQCELTDNNLLFCPCICCWLISHPSTLQLLLRRQRRRRSAFFRKSKTIRIHRHVRLSFCVRLSEFQIWHPPEKVVYQMALNSIRREMFTPAVEMEFTCVCSSLVFCFCLYSPIYRCYVPWLVRCSTHKVSFLGRFSWVRRRPTLPSLVETNWPSWLRLKSFWLSLETTWKGKNYGRVVEHVPISLFRL